MNNEKYKYKLPNNCPKYLEDKKLGCSIEIYRICKNNNLIDSDYIPLYFSKNLKDIERMKKIKKDKDRCQSSGLSVHTDKNEIIKKKKKMPMLGKYISYAKIEKEGEVYDTSTSRWPTHMTFYVYKYFKETDFFKILEKEK